MSATIAKQFDRMGARVKMGEPVIPRWGRVTPEALARNVRLNVLTDKRGTFFDIVAGDDVELQVLDVDAKQRHLLLMTSVPDERPGLPNNKSKFLCGHDERDWFVAAVPENTPASTVRTAMEALKPQAIRDAEQKNPPKRKNRNHRKRNGTWLRQGEWFFLPRPDLKLDEKLIMTKEPLRRGGGKPHVCSELYRTGGQTVYVSWKHPNGLSEAAYARLTPEQRKEQGTFQIMRRDPKVYVRGTVRHKDHKTLRLGCWHEVQMNTESNAAAMANVAFLD